MTCAATLRRHYGAVTTVDFMENSLDLVSGDEEGLAVVWDGWRARKLREVRTTAEFGSLLRVRLLEHGKLWTQSSHGRMAVWDASGAVEAEVRFEPASLARADPMGNHCVAVLERPLMEDAPWLCWYALPSLEKTESVALRADWGLATAVRCISPTMVAVLYENYRVEILRKLNDSVWESIWSSDARSGSSGGAAGLALEVWMEPDGCTLRLYVGGSGRMVRSFRIQLEPECLLLSECVWNVPGKGVSDLRVRSDGRVLAAACWDGVLRVLGTSSGKLVAEFFHHRSGALHACAFAMDGTLAAAGNDHRLSLWNQYQVVKS